MAREARAFARYEAAMCRTYDAILTVISEDRESLLSLFHPAERARLAPKFTAISICVDPGNTPPVARTDAPPPTILHLGTMFWPPNSNGVLWFAREVLPRIHQEMPEARFVVIGKNPPREVENLAADPRIEVAGYVADLQPYLTHTDVFVVPLHAGSGMRVKILDAWMWGLPIVSTPIGAEGILVRDGDNMLLARGARDFAAATLRLLTDTDLNQKLRANGRAWVEQHYSWESVYGQVDRVYEGLLRPGGAVDGSDRPPQAVHWVEDDMAMNVLSVVIPAYNEEEGIAQIIERVLPIRSSLREIGVEDMELIVVDDGSRDRTASIAAQYPEVRLVKHMRNQGYGAAIKTGFGQATGCLLGFLDADGTYPPEYFPELCSVALSEDADLVVGSRMAGADSEMPRVRRLGNLVFANLASLLGSDHVSDSASGMRVIRREALSRLYPLPDGLNFTPVMSVRALHEQINWREVPIPYKERVGRSKLSVVRDGLRFLETIIWTALCYNPVRILGGVGLGLGVVAALIGLGIVIARLSGVTSLGPLGVTAVFVAGLCAFVGTTLFAMGATSNYLVSLFYRNPIRQGLLGHPLFARPLERHFGWMGLVIGLVGLVTGAVSVWLALRGWALERLWFYLLVAAMSLIMGTQLTAFRVIMSMLAELNLRDQCIDEDLQGKPCTVECATAP